MEIAICRIEVEIHILQIGCLSCWAMNTPCQNYSWDICGINDEVLDFIVEYIWATDDL